uniref:JmjC domain-containing protein n=1 Tax=Panagrolaimus davidi TaxID=227884 RepID=A0A914QZZ8_9BILA
MHIQLPRQYNSKLALESQTLSTILEPQAVRQLKLRQTPGIAGFYDMKYQDVKKPTSVKEIRQKLNKMKPSDKYNPKNLFSRQTLSSFKPVIYLHDLPLSYVNKVYESSTELPPGWNLHDLRHTLQSLYKDKDFPGITSVLSYIADVNTISALHREDFFLSAASYLLPGSADKVWISFHPKYQARILERLRQSTNFDKTEFANCMNPINHKAYAIDVELLEELQIPYTLAVQKPGMIAVVLHGAYHQVSNAGISFAEAVNFISHRWDVHAHRQTVFCCNETISYYSSTLWDPLVSHYFGDETDMKKRYKNFQTLVTNAKNKLSSKRTRQISPEIFASETSDESSNSPTSKRQKVVEKKDTWKSTKSNGTETSNSASASITIQRQMDAIFQNTENNRQSRRLIRTQQLEEMEEQLRQLATTQPIATANIVVGAPIVLPESSSSMEAPSKVLKRLKTRQYISKRDAASKRIYEEKRKEKGPRQRMPANRTKDQIRINNALQTKRKEMKSYIEALAEHNNTLRTLSPTDYDDFQQKLIDVRQQINQLLRQRELRNALTIIFKNQLMERRELQGYIHFEIARDYINGQNSTSREMFKTAVGMVKPNDPDFWDNVTASEADWNDCFGVDDDYRVPAREYDILS